MLIQVLIMGECLVVPPLIGTTLNYLRTNAVTTTMTMIRLVAHTGVVLNVPYALQPNLAIQTTLLVLGQVTT
jgi:hypothetical protein